MRRSDLELGLGSDDGVKGIAEKEEVDVGVMLGFRVEGVGEDDDRGITTSDKADVKEEANGANSGGGGELLSPWRRLP